jgi:hypothetical protein
MPAFAPGLDSPEPLDASAASPAGAAPANPQGTRLLAAAELEAEAVYILREAAGQFERP